MNRCIGMLDLGLGPSEARRGSGLEKIMVGSVADAGTDSEGS
jgi:hypothetical protein